MRLKNMKLRSRMILGYASSLTILIFALGFGIIGLMLNVSAFKQYGKMSEQTQIANQIEVALRDSRLAYKHFMTSQSDEAVDAFDLAYNDMQLLIDELRVGSKEIDGDIQIRLLLSEMDSALILYRNDFDQIRDLDDSMLTYYNSIADKGYSMLALLEGIKSTAHINGDDEVNRLAAQSIQDLLRARLHASKYFDFHTVQEYNDYFDYYGEYETDIRLLSSLDDVEPYMNDINLVIKDVDEYKKEMQVLYRGVTDMDELEVALDAKGPEISDMLDSIAQILQDDMSNYSNTIAKDNNRWILEMSGITAFALIVFVLIAYQILKLVTSPLTSLTEAFEGIAEGDTDTSFRLPVNTNDEIGTMSSAFNRFMVKLAAMIEDIRYQNWLKTGQNNLFDLSKDENDLRDLSASILAFVVGHVEGLVGRIYLKEEDGENYRPMASFGIDINDDIVVKPMEGIVGNSIVTRKMITMHKIPKDYMTIRTGLGETLPSQILILPCAYNDEVNCVIEIGHIQPFSATEMVLLEGLSEAIGNVVHSTELRANMRTLLDKTIQQSEELQMQQEELRQSNEELEEQTRALKESEQRLQAQQEELRVSNEELEERSKQLEIQKAALDEKNKAIMESQDEILEKAYELEQANRYKSEFLANMSHELRTPLNSILVLSQLLETRDNTKPLTEKEKEFAKTINTSGTDLLTLINGVLDLSKVEAGRLELLAEDIQIDTLVKEYESLFIPVAEIKGIEFKTELGFGLPDSIIVDRLRLSQIIKNLVSNAVKFTHDGHVELKVRKPSAHECEYTGFSSDTYIAFAVSDTGIGIEPDKKDVIFEAFRQEDGTTSRTYGGTGLGLTISLELSKLLGGDIVLESEVGVGSQFVLIIPLQHDNQSAPSITISRDSSSVEQQAQQSEEKSEQEMSKASVPDEGVSEGTEASVQIGLGSDLLIIEDDETFSSILSQMAEEKGYRAVTTHSGYEGIALAKKLKPAAIILDMGLPDMDGLEVARKLEKDEATSDIPIHIISGREGLEDVQMPKSIIGFLKKPVDIKTIYKTLAKIESLNHRGLKKLLVVGHCGGESFEHFTNLGQVEVVKVDSGEVALEAIKQSQYGCIVLDTKLEDMTGMDFIDAAYEAVDKKIPVVIYTEEDINMDEYDDMSMVAESIILKSEKSEERLKDEVTLFLHDMSKTVEQYEGTISKTLKANVKQKIEDEDKLTGKKVLLVDDDERNVFALLHALEQYGLDVVTAKDGHSAIERFKGESGIGIVLMDIMMPKMDGYEAIKRIRKLEKGSDVPIVALTAKAMVEDRERCIKAGANDYMTKPIDVEKLISLMKVWMA